MDKVPSLPIDDPNEVVRTFFRKNYPALYRKVTLQVRRTPRRQTGKYKTNREARWKLPLEHPDYTPAGQIPLIEAKLFTLLLEFEQAPTPPAEVAGAAGRVLDRQLNQESYRCPITGRHLNFRTMAKEAQRAVHGLSSFHVGHVRPRSKRGKNAPDNVYWTSDLGNRIQGNKSWFDTVKIIIEMAEYQRRREGISWGELVNRFPSE